MERFFILDKYNTWYDWNLILTAKTISDPEPNTNYVNIGGINGSLDLSEALTGEITYKDRTISATFWTNVGTRTEREKLLRDITRVLHGKKIKIVEPDDPTHYFYGRVTIKSKSNILAYLEFTIEAICEPWRYAIEDYTRVVPVSSSTPVQVVINNKGVKTLCPIIKITGGEITITYKNLFKPLMPGEYKITDIKLYTGSNIVGLSGEGVVTFTYKEADL